ncbi:MAG: T9SS type A sorting domain-containing protein [Balneolaceae bacterium]
MMKLFKKTLLAVVLALFPLSISAWQVNSDDSLQVTNLGSAVTQFSFMTSHFMDSTHYVFSRNTAPGRLVGYNVFTGEVTTQISISIEGDRSTEAFSMTSLGDDLYIGANFEDEDRRLSLIKVDTKTGEYTEAAPFYPARMARGMTTSPDGKIFLAMSQQDNARVYEYDPETDEVRELDSFETEPRQAANAVAVTDNYVFVGVGVEAPNLWAYNRETEEKISILPAEFEGHTAVEALALHDDWLIAGASGSSSEPIVALIDLNNFENYRLVNHNHDLVQSIAVGGDIVYFGSGEGGWKYGINDENLSRISDLKSNRGLFYFDEVLYGTDGRRNIGKHNLSTGQTTRMDLAETGAEEWPEPGQSMISVNDKIFVAGHHVLGIHDIENGSYKTVSSSGEAKQMTLGPDGMIYMGMYSSGTMVRFDPERETFRQLAAAPPQNNRPRTISYDEENDFVLMGTQSDNRGSGALTIYDVNNGNINWINKPFADQAVGAVTALDGIAYLGGYQGRLDQGNDAKLAAWDPVSREKLWEIVPVSRNIGIRSLIEVNGNIWGLTRGGTFFVVDPETQEVIHRKEIFLRWLESGRLVEKDGMVVAVSENDVAKINTATFEEEIILTDLSSRWFHWPDAAIDDQGNVYVYQDHDLLQVNNAVFVSNEEITHLPGDFRVHQNYPNPFNPSTNIAFDLPRQEDVQLKAYNMMGQLIFSENLGRKKAGNHVVNFDGSQLSSGVYLIRLSAGIYTSSIKATLIK